uniref:Poly [ADP-ribose] polymerase n=1 Tax=Arcella intermedia TaxID=1963864 RepID=A0A6B2KY06_9EUKA
MKELKQTLELNGVRNQGGLDRLVHRAADGIVFGKATCETCPNPHLCQLKYENGQYNCVAELQWGTCGYKGTAVVIHEWNRKSSLFEDHSFLSEWPEEPVSRPLKKVFKHPIEYYKRDPKLPLLGMCFSAAGHLPKRKHSELRALITSNGGTYLDSVVSDVDYLISSFTEVMTDRPKIQKAKELELAIVSELLVDRLLQEFGFDQSPYLLAGKLPPIAFAALTDELPQPATDKKSKSGSESLSFDIAAIPKELKFPTATVYKDKNMELFNVLLTQTDIKSGDNKFYQLLLFDKNGKGESFGVYRKWGRVGTTIGGYTVSTPSDFSSALEFFEEQYLDKTGNEWKDRHQFKKMPGKYLPVEVDNSQNTKEQPSEQINENIPCYLDPRVADVINLIFDVNMLTREMKELEIDVRKMPLGKLTTSSIQKGYSVLTEIDTLLKSDNPSKKFLLLDYSNRFYTIIPTDFGTKAPTVIDNFDVLSKKMTQLESLLEIQVASTLLNEQSIVGQHPTDTNYQRLGTKLTPMSKYSREYKIIEKYIANGHDPNYLAYKIKIEDAFIITRPEEPDFTANKHIRPRKLLWHGSRLCNYVGILNQGLKIAPPEAPTSGYMFGKGIYFADRVQKSAPFCYPTKENNVGLLLLSDVVVGEPYTVKKPEYITALPEGKHSTLVLAKKIPDPTKNEIGEDKVVIPCGPCIDSGEKDVFLEDQEYVIYSKQSQLKYLVKVKFTFN